MDKVRGGTPKGFTSLCGTCRLAHSVRGLNLQELLFCGAFKGMRVDFPVEQCSQYDDKRVPALYQMEQIAWIVSSRNRGPVGFVGDRSNLEITIEKPEHHFGISVQPGNTPPVSGKKESA